MSEPLGFQNPKVQRLRRLLGRRSARSDEGCFVVEGGGLIGEVVAAGWTIEAQFVAPAGTPVESGAPVYELADGVLERVASTEMPQPLLAVVRMPERSLGDLGGATLVMVGDRISDPGNAGTIMRSAEAAGAEGVAFTAGSVDVYNPKVVRSSAGSLFHVPVVSCALDELRTLGLVLIGTSSHRGSVYTETDLTRSCALVVGNEAHGLDDAVSVDEWVTIPHSGRSESLNVAMAATVLAFEAKRQRSAAGTSRR